MKPRIVEANDLYPDNSLPKVAGGSDLFRRVYRKRPGGARANAKPAAGGGRRYSRQSCRRISVSSSDGVISQIRSRLSGARSPSSSCKRRAKVATST